VSEFCAIRDEAPLWNGGAGDDLRLRVETEVVLVTELYRCLTRPISETASELRWRGRSGRITRAMGTTTRVRPGRPVPTKDGPVRAS